jgi:hypothetical protein
VLDNVFLISLEVFMDEKFLKEARLKAERVVADMPDGDLKLKTFEITLNHLLASGGAGSNGKATVDRKARHSAPTPRKANTLAERILMLQSEGFFNSPQTIGAVREGLQIYGWHYPVTTLSGTLQSLVQKRKLRRERVKENKKIVWKYSNP